MKVTVSYEDHSAFVLPEVEANVLHHFGEYATVKIEADSNKPDDIIFFGIQQLITFEHLSLIFDSDMYAKDLEVLKQKVRDQLNTILNSVILENELKAK